MSTEHLLKLGSTRQQLEADNINLSRSNFTNVNLTGAVFNDVNLAGVLIQNACCSTSASATRTSPVLQQQKVSWPT
jgi:hypothetical protein